MYLVIVFYNREGFDEYFFGLFDDLFYKFFMLFMFYDMVIFCNLFFISFMESVLGEGDEKLLVKIFILVVEDNLIN